MQSCAVGLFHAHQIALAPVYDRSLRPPQTTARMAGSIRFNAPKFSGTLELSLSETTLSRINGDGGHLAARDLVRELTNQLMGRVKNRLLQFQLELSLGVPTSAVLGSAVERPVPAGKTRHVYSFRTREDLIYVTLEGSFELSGLVFSPERVAADEGDVILF
ncbi:MAG TPA: hypothetical protein VKZ49_08225 [Polyangiaceae bacterium]|nr:hypothetical protein [Polyangiaceae bacterium]